MNAQTNQATMYGININETSAAINRARYAMLDELPGVLFGIMTLAWILTSLFGLV